LGRPPGKQGSLKLDKKIGVVQEYLDLGLSKRKMAKALGVAYCTLDEFIVLKKKGFGSLKVRNAL
jgi:putative DNA-invertase from lambdoid prophage Rac